VLKDPDSSLEDTENLAPDVVVQRPRHAVAPRLVVRMGFRRDASPRDGIANGWEAASESGLHLLDLPIRLTVEVPPSLGERPEVFDESGKQFNVPLAL
jgi:hypothetical protein